MPVVVDFWADWCGPCKLINPLLGKLQTAAGDSIKIVKVECDANPDLVDQYDVRTGQGRGFLSCTAHA